MSPSAPNLLTVLTDYFLSRGQSGQHETDHSTPSSAEVKMHEGVDYRLLRDSFKYLVNLDVGFMNVMDVLDRTLTMRIMG